MLHNDKMFEDETWQLITELHRWPSQLNIHMELCDERHRTERQEIENYIINKK